MRIDYDYLKNLLDVLLECECPTVTWDDFEKFESDDEHRLVLHLRILKDMELLVPDGSYDGLGIEKLNDSYRILIRPWRLSAAGHDFATALTKPNVLERIRTQFNDEGVAVVVDLVKKLAMKQASKLLDDE